MPREIITLACTECGNRTYTGTKNKKKASGRLEIKKFADMTVNIRFTRRRAKRGRMRHRAVALIGRAAVSKTAGWGFESLLPCHIF